MAAGLGKNSPIQLTFTRENYEALILRHGQYVRWMQANKCTCLLRSGRPDPTCKKCGGDGIFFGFQLNKNLYSKPCSVTNGYAFIDNSEFTENANIKEVYLNGKQIADFKIDCGVIASDKITKIDSVICHGSTSREKKKNAVLHKVDKIGKIWAFTDDYINSETTKIYPDITAISFTDAKIQTEKVSRNYIYLKNEVNAETLQAAVRYIMPEKFLIHSQTKDESTQNFLSKYSADSSMTYPYEFDIAKDDVVTLLFACKLDKGIITASGTECDTLPEWFVSEIVGIESFDCKYTHPDFLLYDRNKIKWLNPDNAPLEGTKLSVAYRYCPSYRVVAHAEHDVRSAENQLLPKMVALKLIVTGGDTNEGIEENFSYF